MLSLAAQVSRRAKAKTEMNADEGMPTDMAAPEERLHCIPRPQILPFDPRAGWNWYAPAVATRTQTAGIEGVREGSGKGGEKRRLRSPTMLAGLVRALCLEMGSSGLATKVEGKGCGHGRGSPDMSRQ